VQQKTTSHGTLLVRVNCQGKEGEVDMEVDASGQPSTVDVGGKEKKLTNQFNFSERASQTYNNPMRVSQSVNDLTRPDYRKWG